MIKQALKNYWPVWALVATVVVARFIAGLAA